MTTITYNGYNPFNGLSPTPLVGRQEQMIQVGDRWCQLETLSLKGLITGYCPNFQTLTALQQSLISGFAKDFQPFQIYDGSSLVFERDFVKVANISFGQSDYAYAIPYDITLQVYPSGYFSGTFGVLEPKEEFSFSDSRDGIMTINHLISAKGLNTSAGESNANANAQAWVQSREGFTSQILPIFTNTSGITPCLTTSVESINRLSATYQVRETYTADLLLQGSGILRYTVTCDYKIEDGLYTVEVKGDIIGCKNGTIDAVRSRYAAFNALQEAMNEFWIVTGRTDLNPVPIGKVVAEDQAHQRLVFSYTFTDSAAPATQFDFKASFSYNSEDDLVSAEIEGIIRSNIDLSVRWGYVTSYANQVQTQLYNILNPIYITYANSIGLNGSLYALNPLEDSFTRTENPFTYEIALNAAFTNQILPPDGLWDWDYSIQVSPPLHQYVSVPCLNTTPETAGTYVVFDMGYSTREKLSIKAEGVGESRPWERRNRKQTSRIYFTTAMRADSSSVFGWF